MNSFTGRRYHSGFKYMKEFNTKYKYFSTLVRTPTQPQS